MDLKMEVYSPALELLGLLEIQNSVIWERKAFSAGSFSVEALITEESKTLLVSENIIWIAGEDAGIIEYIQEEAGENGPYITVKGCDLTGILARRILWGRYDLSGPVPALMYQLVDDCCIHPTRGDAEARVIPNLRLSDVPGGGTSIRTQKTGGSLLEALELMGEAYQVPFGVRFVPEVPCMEFWARPGVNRSVHQTVNEPVFYSTELDDVLSSEYSYNAQDYRNVALVAGEGEGKDRVMVTVVGKVETEPEPPTPPEPPEPPVVKYTVSATIDPAGSGTVTGAGTYEAGQTVTLTAAPGEGYKFTVWTENGETVSESDEYTFTVDRNMALVAVFAVASRLPEGYTEVEYIETNSRTMVNTGITVETLETRVVMQMAPIAVSDAMGYLFSAVSDVYASKAYYLEYNGYQNNFTWCCGPSVSSSKIAHPLTANKDVLVDMDSIEKKIKFDESVFDITPYPTNYSVKELVIGGYLYNGYQYDSFPMKIYSAKVYSNGELAGDFITCVNQDGVAGLYDLVSNSFKTNSASSGDITPGPAV